MGSAQVFVRDLAVILGVAAATTVACHWLRQPVVLGYLVAGVIVGPHFTPALVADEETLHAISGLGVILILFGLGLEFSFARLVELGLRPAFIAVVEMGLMMWLGFSAGRVLGWSHRESLFAGACVCVSSTAIIQKAFSDQGVDRPLQSVVFGTLVYEDLVGFVLLATLTALSVGQEMDAGVIGEAAVRLLVFLAVMITAGFLIVPRAVRGLLRLRKRETLIVASVGLCFAMALASERAGYSAALGAFLAGSLVSESGHGELIERLVQPLRDVFGAVFFVSVGTLIDPTMLAAHWGVVLLLSAVVVVGKVLGVSVATFLTGRDTQTSMRAGMSMAQIGEFSFLFAALGVTSGATGSFFYPVIVGVASITAFSSPLLIRHSSRFALWLDGRLPRPLRTFVPLYAAWLEDLRSRGGKDARWKEVRRAIRAILLDSILVVAIVAATSLSSERLGGLLGQATGVTPRVAGLLVLLGFVLLCPWPVYGILRAARRLAQVSSEIVLPRSATGGGVDTAAAPRRTLLVGIQIAIVLCVGIPLLAITDPFLPGIPVIGVLLLVIVLALSWTFWRRAADLQGHVRAGAEIIAEALGRVSRSERSVSMGDVQALLPGLGDISSFSVGEGSHAVGRSLSELDLRGRTGATVVAIAREGGSVLMPDGTERLRAGDMLGITGSHAACDAARKVLGERG